MDGTLQSRIRVQKRPLFGEGGHMTVTREADIEGLLQRACITAIHGKSGSVNHISSPELVHISRLIGFLDRENRRLDRDRWSLRPRLYTLLRGIDATGYMDEFVKHSVFDISLPFSPQTLPFFFVEPELRHAFLAKQACVLTDARLLESRDDDHLHLSGSADDHLTPFQQLGSGGFGAVDLVCSRLSTRSYARKRVYRGRDSEATRREQQYLVEEIRVLKLLSYRHLTQIIQSYSDRDYIGYLMEPIADCNLHRYLVQKRIPDTGIVHLRHFFGCLAGAVHYLHSKSIRHRDLKLENILVKQNRVYVADFGTAMEWSASRRGTTQDRGVPVTEWYMAPEVDDRGPRNVASDMWSLGVVFLEMLTVVKGQTITKWKDFLKRKALKAKIEPRPCRNIDIIHEWMEVLNIYSPRLENYDDESMALKDNAPLRWITDLLTRQPDNRMNAKRLVKTILESGYLLDFACFDCVHDFKDTRYVQVGGDHWAEDDTEQDRKAIDAEVTALVGMADPVEQQIEEEKQLTVLSWLDQSSKHWEDPSIEGCNTFAMPGSLEPRFVSDQLHNSKPITYDSNSDHTLRFRLAGSKSKAAEVKGVLHEGGFLVQQDDDSSVDGEAYQGVKQPNSPNDLFPIVQDVSSDSSEEANQAMAANTRVSEDINDDRLCTILEEVSDDGTPMQDKMVHYNACVEDDVAEPTIELDRVPPLNGPILQDNSNADCDLRRDTTKPQQSKILKEASLDKALTKTLIASPSPDRSSSRKTATKPPIKPHVPMLLRWYEDLETTHGSPAMLADTPPMPHPSVPAIQDTTPVAQWKVKPSSPKLREDLATAIAALGRRPSTMQDRQGLAKSKLSAANIDRLNELNMGRSKKWLHFIDDDDFTPASYIETAWQTAEAADSLATSVMSATTAKRLSGLMLVWHDKSYHYLEYYCKVGKVGAVRALLDQGCNCGTILKPRPGPLFNAIAGSSARHNKCVGALVKAGCDVNAQVRGKTALHKAVELPYFQGYQKLLAILLAAGAEVNEHDQAGEYPLLKLFKGATEEPLEEYQRQSLALMLHSRVQCAVDVNVRQAVTLETALHLAIRRRTPQAVALLVHRGADINAMDASGTTPLLAAANQWHGALNGHQERTLAFLLSAENIDVNATGGTLRRAALHNAAAAGCATALHRLLDGGADTHLTDKEGHNALAVLKNTKMNGVEFKDFQVMVDLLSR